MDLDDIEAEDILKAVAEGGRPAILAHKQAGHPIVVYHDGQILVIPADERIVVPEPDD